MKFIIFIAHKLGLGFFQLFSVVSYTVVGLFVFLVLAVSFSIIYYYLKKANNEESSPLISPRASPTRIYTWSHWKKFFFLYFPESKYSLFLNPTFINIQLLLCFFLLFHVFNVLLCYWWRLILLEFYLLSSFQLLHFQSFNYFREENTGLKVLA